MPNRELAVEGNVFGVAIATDVHIAYPQLQCFFPFQLMGEGTVLDHELGVLAGGLRKSLIEFEGNEPLFDALLIDERKQLLLTGGVELRLRVSA